MNENLMFFQTYFMELILLIPLLLGSILLIHYVTKETFIGKPKKDSSS